MSFISVDDVRNLSGVDSDLMTDAQIQDLIDMVETDTSKWLNTKFVPTMQIDILDGNGQDWIYTDKNPLLNVRNLVSDETTVDVSAIHTYRSSGKISFGTNSGLSIFVGKKQSVKIAYYFGLLEESSTTTTSSDAAVAGSSVNIEVVSSTNFEVDDWVDVYGIDGNKEVAQVTVVPDSTHITVDQIVYGHVSGSVIVKLQIPEGSKNFYPGYKKRPAC